jgi:hypothetical protein
VFGFCDAEADMIQGFQKIFHLFDNNSIDIFDGEVEVTEKLDGSQFNFGRIDGVVQMRSKGAAVFFEDNNKMFQKAKDFVRSVSDRLQEGVIFHGEYFQAPRHNTLAYRRVPLNNFALFGITEIGHSGCVPDLAEGAKFLGCESVSVLFRGNVSFRDADDAKEWIALLLNRESALGGAHQEGVVVKNYGKKSFYAGKDLPITCAKWVTAEFKEKHKVAWKESNGSPIEKIARAYESKARWIKAIQRLRDEGKLENSVRDIGPLLKSIATDLSEEESEQIKAMLFKLFWADIQRMTTRGFPEFYKQYLLDNAVISGSQSDVTGAAWEYA